jgi:hypothetical protein
MKDVSRREFLILSAGAGLGVLNEVPASKANVRVGLIGGSAGFELIQPLASLREVKIDAIAGAPASEMDRIGAWLQRRGDRGPDVYGRAEEMLHSHKLDVVFASAGTDPLDFIEARDRSPCAQLIPACEFAISSERRHLVASIRWTRATIRHRTGLPVPAVSSRTELEKWIWSEIGSVLDFAMEATAEIPSRLTATSAPATPPGSAVFSVETASISILLHADSLWREARPRTELMLTDGSASVMLRGAQRSEAFTRLLIRNALDAALRREPDALLFSPDALLPARRIAAEFAGRVS